MLYLYLALLLLLNTFWLVTVLFGLPGNWLIVISTAAFTWWQSDRGVFSIVTLIFITILALSGEIIEFFAGMGGAKKAGAGWLSSIGAVGGMVTGALIGTFILPIPILGTLIGACIGAATAVVGLELLGGRKLRRSVFSGAGAGAGVLVGIICKFAIGSLIWLIVVIAVVL